MLYHKRCLVWVARTNLNVTIVLCVMGLSFARYLYKGLALGDPKVSAAMFPWHEKLVAEAGVGCVLRTLSDKSTSLTSA